jgi:hypothetical protein
MGTMKNKDRIEEKQDEY